MDHHFYQQQWHPHSHPVPIQGATLCPICSISHFPFCPPHPPPSFNQNPNPRYLFSSDFSFQTPCFDPYHSPMSIPRPFIQNPNDNLSDQRPWNRNPNIPHDHIPHDYTNNGFLNDSERTFKRPRVDEFGSGTVSALHEHRLKLIRDHGGGFGEELVGFRSDLNHDGGYLNQRNELRYSDIDNRQSSWLDHRNNSSKLNGHDRYFWASNETHSFQLREFSNHGHLNFEGNCRSPIKDASFFNEQEQPPLPASPPPPLPCDSHLLHASAESKAQDSQAVHPLFSKKFAADGQPLGLNQLSYHKPKIVDAAHLFKRPHRSTRPDHIVVILRGLPGSGKSYLAKMLRDVEVENGGDAPRIHSMDDYFMAEVEKVEQSGANSSNSVKGKKPTVKMVMEYCYEPEMEEAYRSSMLKAFKKTVEEGVFTFVIVDDRNLRVADFAQFWAIAKSSGYEVYILEATYRDPAGCAARNVHGFTLNDIQKMARQWEVAPPLYLQLDIKSLCNGDDLKDSGIQEVDMDMEDGDDDSLSTLQETKYEKTVLPPLRNNAPEDDEKGSDAEPDHLREEVKELGRSKWSNDLDEDDTERTHGLIGNATVLSGLIKEYARKGKSVHWIDQIGNKGFSIGAAKMANKLSLLIGPGTGYNLKSNPLPEDDSLGSTHGSSESKRHRKFEERLRAESESFKVVFDKRRQRIGLAWEEE